MWINFYNQEGHYYTLAAVGTKFHVKRFASRAAALDTLYAELRKRALHIEKIYDDKHDKTYVCSDGVRFFINRDC